MGTIAYELMNKIAFLTIKNAPANALSSSVIKDLSKQLDRIEKDSDAKVIVLKGEGNFFSAGADIKEFTKYDKASDFQSLSESGQRLFERIENLNIPAIAAIHGAALGGGMELAMACHIRLATESAKLGLPEISLGVIPGYAGTQRLPRIAGAQKAYEMLLTGDVINGREAFSHGLINTVTAENNLLEETNKLANKIAEKSKMSIQQIMKLISFAKTENHQLGAREEAIAFGETFVTQDAKEGIQAFLEKRKPKFQDK